MGSGNNKLDIKRGVHWEMLIVFNISTGLIKRSV